MKGLKLTTLAALLVGLNATSLVMAKQPGEESAKAKDKMEQHVSAKDGRDIYADEKKEKEEKFKKDHEKDHEDGFLVDDEYNGQHQDKREKMHDQDEDGGSSGLYKQHDKKMDQEQKELGRGSEQGQETREQHNRKWWKFWE